MLAYWLVPLGIGMILVGLWLMRRHFDLEWAFYRRYEPRPMTSMSLIMLGGVVMALALL